MLLRIALRSLIQHRRRTSLLLWAISFVTFLLAMLLALTQSIYATMLDSATALVSGDVTVRGFYKATVGQSAAVLSDAPKVEGIIRDALPDTERLSYRGRGWARLVSETATVESALVGIDIAKDDSLRGRLVIVSGTLDGLRSAQSILLFQKFAKRLGVRVGDALTISMPTMTGMSNTIDVPIVAIAADVGLISDELAVVPNEVIRRLYQIDPRATSSIQVYLKDPSRIAAAQEALRSSLAREGYLVMEPDPQPFFMKYDGINQEDWTGQKVDVGTWEDEVIVARWTLPVLRGLSFVITAILLVVVAVGVSNSLWTSLRERTRELGTLRAIGMRRSGVVIMMVLEGFLLGLGGAVLGALGGALLCAFLTRLSLQVPTAVQIIMMRQTLRLALTLGDAAVAVTVVTSATTLVSILPSLRASRMKPVMAMQRTG